MTYNIHTNSEIQDVILDAKHVVTGWLGKLVSVKKKKADLSIRPECKLTMKCQMFT